LSIEPLPSCSCDRLRPGAALRLQNHHAATNIPIKKVGKLGNAIVVVRASIGRLSSDRVAPTDRDATVR
jgi:hypothetical protein